MPPRFKGAEHGDHERVLCEGEDVPLHERLLDLVPQDQILLVDLLHGEALTRLSVAHQVDGPGKSSQQKNQQKAPERNKKKEKRSLLPIGAVTDEFDILKIFLTWWFDGSSFSLGRHFHITKKICRKANAGPLL